MNLEKYISISGIPGIHRVLATRSNGIIIEDLENKKNRFVSSRKHQFTPLESISIYTDDGESTELSKVFQTMKDQMKDNTVPALSSDAATIKGYFEKILPNYDKDRVHNSDIKKAIKWFNYLNDKQLLISEEPKKDDKPTEEVKPNKEDQEKEKTEA